MSYNPPMSDPCSYACIFDVDGVLVDSYAAHLQSWRDLAAETSAAFTESDFAASFGRTSRDIIQAYWPGGLSEDDIAKLDDRKEAIYRELIADCFPAMPGAAELLRALCEAGFMIALGSSGPPENIDLVVDGLDCRSMLGAVITGRDVTRGKPDPQVFLLAAERLGAAPSRCCVIEDAPAGVIAANAAGMKSIGFVSTGRTHDELAAAGADRITSSLGDIEPRDIAALIDLAIPHGRG